MMYMMSYHFWTLAYKELTGMAFQLAIPYLIKCDLYQGNFQGSGLSLFKPIVDGQRH